jgi:hypothetical protein
MICQRCGLCCATMSVPINVKGHALLKPGGLLCPHLTFDGTQSTCAVHAEPWFKQSACHIYGNSHIDIDFYNRRGQPCRLGELIQKSGGFRKVRPDIPQASVEDLEDLGDWNP